MKIEITANRRYKGKDYTIGDLFINGEKICDYLEPKDRGLNQSDSLEVIKAAKVKGKTAIPAGRYRVIVNMSPRFKRNLPRLLKVPGYEGVLIHSGNSIKDTTACLLPGENKVVGKVINSRIAEKKILELLKDASEIYITIG